MSLFGVYIDILLILDMLLDDHGFLFLLSSTMRNLLIVVRSACSGSHVSLKFKLTVFWCHIFWSWCCLNEEAMHVMTFSDNILMPVYYATCHFLPDSGLYTHTILSYPKWPKTHYNGICLPEPYEDLVHFFTIQAPISARGILLNIHVL